VIDKKGNIYIKLKGEWNFSLQGNWLFSNLERRNNLRKLLITICIVLLISPLVKAQIPTGSVYGNVIDEEGNPLPGVTLTLDSELIRAVNTVTSLRGSYRFVGLPPGKDYSLTCKLGGFRTETLTAILVRVDSSTEINITMRLGAIEEEVTVTAQSPIVQIKTTRVSHNVDHQLLQSLPSARDPWVVAQMAPGVVMDRENVGGSESGQQSDMVVRGQTGGQTTYNIDGMNITDPDAIGASPGYYDFDSFEEIDFTLGGADVTQQQAGINLNISSGQKVVSRPKKVMHLSLISRPITQDSRECQQSRISKTSGLTSELLSSKTNSGPGSILACRISRQEPNSIQQITPYFKTWD
jgi:hypothetical protein